MRAVVAHAFGMLDALSIEEIDPAPIGTHDVRIAVHAAALSFVDALIAEGRYQLKPDLPCTPGCECAGIVEAVGVVRYIWPRRHRCRGRTRPPV